MWLSSPPGPLRRWIAFRFCQITKREVEYLALTRDTTESDLKQRREIQGGSVKYIDQVAVRAAINGRILILEGLEKCERNVLPVLNNLLENREMHLEDGYDQKFTFSNLTTPFRGLCTDIRIIFSRFLVSPKRFAQIQKTHTPEQIKALGLVPVHPRFQVIALGLPVPRFEGNPLDPPLRSRFQARNVNALASDAQLAIIRHMYPKVDPATVSKIVSFAEALNRMQQLTSAGVQSQDDSLHIARMLALPPTAAVDAARLLGQFPKTDIRDILTRVYPFEARPDETEVIAIRSALASLGLLLPVDVAAVPASSVLDATEVSSFDIQETRLESVAGTFPFVETEESASTLAALSQDDDVGFDICVIGEQGSGKSRLVQRFASSRHRGWRTMQMYRDMTARDLLQRRATDEKGDTVWINSPLVTAAIQGDICVLDGVHRLGPGTLSVLQQLVHDRQAQLCDGRLLTSVGPQSSHEKIVAIHPRFRIAALATPPTKIGRGNWLSSEISAMFHFHLLRDVSVSHKLAILDRLFPHMKIAAVVSSKLQANPSMSSSPMQYAVSSLIKFLRILENARKKGMSPSAGGKAPIAPAGGDSGSELPKVSLRQLIRVCKRVSQYPEDLAEALEDTLLLKFLPTAVRDVIVQMLEHSGILALQLQQDKMYTENLDQLRIRVTETTVSIGTETNSIPAVSLPKYHPKNAALIPKITFFEIPNHVRLLREMLKDLILTEHILLIGNQGVGKNILADCLLEMLRIEREYIQLHRGTISRLTSFSCV
jgi:von Willebrand factor A domain-containing protein 8